MKLFSKEKLKSDKIAQERQCKMGTISLWKKKWAILMLALPLVLASCDLKKRFQVQMWMGGNHEIIRNVKVDGEEFVEYLETNDPKFLEFRCMQKDHMDVLIRAALERCRR